MKNISLFKYKDAIGSILIYQILSKAILLIVMKALLIFNDLVIDWTNITVFVNLDFGNFLMSIPFDVLMFFTFLILGFYTIIDIMGMILLSKKILQNQSKNSFDIIKEACITFKAIFNKKGLPIIGLAFLLCPLYICFYRHSLMEGFYVPDFTYSVLNKIPWLYIPYFLIYVLLLCILFFYSLALPSFVLKKTNLAEAYSFSKEEIKSNCKDYFKRYGMVLFRYVVIWIVLAIVFGVIPLGLLYLFFSKSSFLPVLLTFIYLVDVCLICLMKGVCPVFFTMDVIKMVESKEEAVSSIHIGRILSVVSIGLVIASICISSCSYFDVLFPIQKETKIIAHKAGGKYANENTLEGLEESIKNNIYGGEVDVQRTKDGYYIIHHDDTFKRLCGVEKTSSDLTLAECKKLEVKDDYHTTTSHLSTIEEILDTAKNKIHMFVELKGKTADSQMAEDLYQMVKDRDMIDQVTFICLDYDVISEMEAKHPDADTGYICYVALGNIDSIHCDKLLIENAMATRDTIAKIHNANKEVYIWTVDSYRGLQDRFIDDTDGVITNEVDRAIKIRNHVDTNKPMNRVFNRLLDWR